MGVPGIAGKAGGSVHGALSGMGMLVHNSFHWMLQGTLQVNAGSAFPKEKLADTVARSEKMESQTSTMVMYRASSGDIHN